MGSINDKRMSLYLFKPRNIVANKLNSNIFRTGLFNSLYYFVKFFYIFTCIKYVTNYSTITCINTHVNKDSMTNKIKSFFLKK